MSDNEKQSEIFDGIRSKCVRSYQMNKLIAVLSGLVAIAMIALSPQNPYLYSACAAVWGFITQVYVFLAIRDREQAILSAGLRDYHFNHGD